LEERAGFAASEELEEVVSGGDGLVCVDEIGTVSRLLAANPGLPR